MNRSPRPLSQGRRKAGDMKRLEFECVDRKYSNQIRKLGDGELDPKERERWQTHLKICHACREDEVLGELLPELILAGVGVEAKETDSPPPRRPRRYLGARHVWAGAGVSLAAGLTMVFLMSPHRDSVANRGFSDTARGDLVFWIDHPVEGEVLKETGGELTWQTVDEATSYRITVETMDGERRWVRTAMATRIELPAESDGAGDYVAIVEPIPRGLVSESQADVAFKRSGWAAFIAYRLAHAAWLSLAPLALAIGLGALAILRRH
jgi:hypothetical protein